jgi:hypothetical protein
MSTPEEWKDFLETTGVERIKKLNDIVTTATHIA